MTPFQLTGLVNLKYGLLAGPLGLPFLLTPLRLALVFVADVLVEVLFVFVVVIFVAVLLELFVVEINAEYVLTFLERAAGDTVER